ncbi:MAG: S-adenosylmethionine-dependent methyltransferase [Watsoniomyces obsoletus]|nr:MAG: S-adenosylmethionine-dependent methyltransferase [Watsoniomyces obsoletus]
MWDSMNVVVNAWQAWLGLIVLGLLLSIIGGSLYAWTVRKPDAPSDEPSGFRSLCVFIYASFLKPHTGDDEGYQQQHALESFYKSQASVYDATRRRLLRGREDMLGIVAAQLRHRADTGQLAERIWVDFGGGTGYNIEAMSAHLSVPDFFSAVYLVDLSPSLCEIARRRFARLGWKNVKVICQDVRSFRLEDHEPLNVKKSGITSDQPWSAVIGNSGPGRVDLITLSYALSMIPEFYSVIDAFSTLLAPTGVVGVVDFYVQSIVDVAGRNYTGGVFNRHVNWLGRVFWRAWFEADRVGLEAARRDYLEYRYGTILSVDERNYMLGGIPYYIWVGCLKELGVSMSRVPNDPREVVRRLDAAATESPYLLPVEEESRRESSDGTDVPEVRSKAYESAIVNLTSNLPLPAFFYQNHHWRMHYNDQLRKHTQFNNEYIYAFTWEDVRTDRRLLKIKEDDVLLAITSAGDNILAYALDSPKRIHAVDLNPTQNHLLELKIAAFASLEYTDVWKLFGDGKHERFREILISKLSPHLSSRAFQYWLDHSQVFTSKRGFGLYQSGGSRHAILLVKWLFRVFGLGRVVERLCLVKTLNEQREIWQQRIRKVLLNKILSQLVISTDSFLWKALGVPLAQRTMIESDFAARNDYVDPNRMTHRQKGQAIWEYMVNTLDPVVETTLIGEDNYFYLLCVQGSYSKRCHPAYLTSKAHTKLSRQQAFDGLRIHTDELYEVMTRLMPGSLTIAVVMDSMDWLPLHSPKASEQITALNQALKKGGRVLLRSAGLWPWYIDVFAQLGFVTQRVGARHPGTCIDRVNMYASTWLCTKSSGVSTSLIANGIEKRVVEASIGEEKHKQQQQQKGAEGTNKSLGTPERLEI